MNADRKAFEDAVFNRRFRASIVRNPSPPPGFGGFDLISKDCPTQAELCTRAGDDYADEAVSAMWWGWRHGREAIGRGEHHKLDNDRQVFFYEQDFYVLSNFSAFTLYWRGLRFDTSEAAYHFDKFPDQPAIRAAIKNASSAHEAFKIAEANKEHRRRDWDDVKVGVMRNILYAKAAQHEYVRRKLLATGDRVLIEDSWRDDYWGWGPNRDGQNMLGRLWMEVRTELRGARADSEGGEP